MVKFISRVGGNTGRFLALATVATVLTACGGSSGDSDPGGFEDADGDGFDDNTGLTEAEFLAQNPDVFVDADGDGFDDNTGLTEAEFLAQSTPDPVFTPISVSTPCGSEGGTINDGGMPDWGDNCEVRREGQFENSRYSAGIQRIVYCAGFGDAASYAAFADGIFGPNTEAAVREFQRADLTPDTADGLDTILDDGRVGPQTWAKLQASMGEPLVEGDFDTSTTSRDTYGFSSGRCANIPLFYQSTTFINDESGIRVERGGWTLARNQPNEAEAIAFTKDPIGGL